MMTKWFCNTFAILKNSGNLGEWRETDIVSDDQMLLFYTFNICYYICEGGKSTLGVVVDNSLRKIDWNMVEIRAENPFVAMRQSWNKWEE